jgi:Pyruvate/2-oxoacid:ferredoxin oxidoreductase delta subunit
MNKQAIVCRCRREGLVSASSADAVLKVLHENAVPVWETPDFCAAVEAGDLRLKGFSGLVVACHERAVRGLLAVAQVEGEVAVVDARGQGDADQLVPQVRAFVASGPTPVQTDAESAPSSAAALEGWFPVIDYERCSRCMKCLTFCLFDVYAAGVRGVEVEQPGNCKPGCPACARVCPNGAIVFPKSPEECLNGGTAERSATDAKSDLSALLGGDVYERLRERRPFDPKRTPDEGRALRERQLAILAAQRLLEGDKK